MASRIIWPLLILQVATVVAIVFFLRMLLHKQLQFGLKRIQNLDQENLKKETKLNQRLKQLDKEYKARIAQAQRETQAMIDAAGEQIKKMQEEERLEAKKEAKRIIASALQEKEKLLQEAEQGVFNKAINLSTLILKRIFSESELKDLRCKVSKEVIDFLISSEQIKQLLQKNKELEVVTAKPLTKEDKNYILKIIEDSSGGKANATFTVDKDVLGGLILKIDKQIIDGSLAYRINKAAAEIKEGT